MNTLSLLVSAFALSLVACAAPSSETEASGSSTSNIEGASEPGALWMEVPDLDGDELPETFESRVDRCGTGGCWWTIHLSKIGAGGEVFAKIVEPRIRGSATVVTSFWAYQRDGMCHGKWQTMAWEGDRYVEQGNGMDCNEIIKRPEGAPIAQFEMMCLDMVPPHCKDLP